MFAGFHGKSMIGYRRVCCSCNTFDNARRAASVELAALKFCAWSVARDSKLLKRRKE
jgi:hypothetical protein